MTSAVASQLLMGWDGTLPVDPTKFAVASGISVKYDKGLSDAGRSGYSDPEIRTIFINPTEPARRQRFTVAHELGHCLLGHGCRDRKKGTLMSYEPDEAAANQFAAELLMPENAIRYFAAQKNLQDLMEIFDVSQSAIYFRLKNLRLI